MPPPSPLPPPSPPCARLWATALPEMLTKPPSVFATPPPSASPPRPPTASLWSIVLSRRLTTLPGEGVTKWLLPLFPSPPPMPAPTMVPVVLPSPPTARLWRSVTLLRVRLTAAPVGLLAEVAIPPPLAVPTNWNNWASAFPRLPLPPRASLSSKRQSATSATPRLFRPPPNAVPTSPFPPVLVLLEPPRARLPLTVLPVSTRAPSLKMPAPPAGAMTGPGRVLLDPPRARLPRNVLFSTVTLADVL